MDDKNAKIIEPFADPHGFLDDQTEEWAPKQLKQLLDDDATRSTLRERMENWGSD